VAPAKETLAAEQHDLGCDALAEAEIGDAVA